MFIRITKLTSAQTVRGFQSANLFHDMTNNFFAIENAEL
jgi:hypothetical protein